MREKLIEAAFRAFREQDKLGRDWFDLNAADDGKTILDGAYDLGSVIDAILDTLREAMPSLYLTIREASLGTDPDSGSNLPIWDNWEPPTNRAEDRALWKAVVGYDIYHTSYDWPSWQEAILTKALHAVIDHIKGGK